MVSPEQKNSLLEIFVTSATDPVYAVKATVHPEVWGAFASYFSRSSKDFREHLWSALTGKLESEEEKEEINLEWLLSLEYKQPADALLTGLQKSRQFFTKWYGNYGHKSVANVVWIPMVATNVSQLFTKELAYDQLAFFIERSTRFFLFAPENVCYDPDIMRSPHKQEYEEAIISSTNTYKNITKEAIALYEKQLPFTEWLKRQDEGVKREEVSAQKAKYKRELRGKALDLSRFLLPQAIKTDIAWILDARSTEFDVSVWKLHPLAELREVSNLIEKHAGIIAPSLLRYTEKNFHYKYPLYSQGDTSQSFEKGVTILSHDPEGLEKLVAHFLHAYGRGGSYIPILQHVRETPFPEKLKVLYDFTQGRQRHDERSDIYKVPDLLKVNIEIRSDIGAIRDLRRHQKADRAEPYYTLDNGYTFPQPLEELSREAQQLFRETMEKSHEAEIRIRKEFPVQAQYLLPMATNHALVASFGLDNLLYTIFTRTTPEANFSYRQDAFNLAEALAKVHPWLLGLEKYPEGKSIREVYRDAPLKDLLRLDLRENTLHE